MTTGTQCHMDHPMMRRRHGPTIIGLNTRCGDWGSGTGPETHTSLSISALHLNNSEMGTAQGGSMAQWAARFEGPSSTYLLVHPTVELVIWDAHCCMKCTNEKFTRSEPVGPSP